MDHLVLASASPRRLELLKQIGLSFSVRPVGIDESWHSGESPREYVSRLAIEKALAARELGPGDWVLGSDTTVVIDDVPMGKPRDRKEALSMLRRLSGRSHEVLSGVALAGTRERFETVVSTRVVFRELEDAEIEAYWMTGEPADKAGGYGIQGMGGVFVSRIEGSYSNVVGLPLAETAALLRDAGLPVWSFWTGTSGVANE